MERRSWVCRLRGSGRPVEDFDELRDVAFECVTEAEENAEAGTTADEVLTRELEDVACAHAEELATAVPGFRAALAWP